VVVVVVVVVVVDVVVVVGGAVVGVAPVVAALGAFDAVSVRSSKIAPSVVAGAAVELAVGDTAASESEPVEQEVANSAAVVITMAQWCRMASVWPTRPSELVETPVEWPVLSPHRKHRSGRVSNMAIDFALTLEIEALPMRTRAFVTDVIKLIENELEGHGPGGGRGAPLTGGDRFRQLVELRKAAFKEGIWLPHMPQEWGGMALVHAELATV
jgi:hypothetical protein